VTTIKRLRHALFAAALLTLSLATGSATAEHEADHRYRVEGYVLDTNRRPVTGLPIVVRLDNDVLEQGTTADDGFYSLQLHLHDSDWGKRLRIAAGSDEATITVSFQRGDQRTSRIHHANFIGGRLNENRIARGRSQTWIYITVAILVAALGIIGYRFRKQQVRKRRKEETKLKGATQKRPRKKKKR